MRICINRYTTLSSKHAYTLRKSMTSGDSGDAPEDINRTLPPSLAFILLNTSLSHMGDGVLPAHGRNMMGKKKKTSSHPASQYH